MFDNLSALEIIKLLMPLLIIQLALMIFSMYRLFKDKVKYLPKWAWFLIILLGEIIGPLVFLIFGREKD
ncbi:MAG TPA: hypothetical protein DD426_04315 [Clostridiaceae bacterium]|nr:hypothetical protein [Clostridiaceae bacterium]